MKVNAAALHRATTLIQDQWPSVPPVITDVANLPKWPGDIVVVTLDFAREGDNDPFVGWLVAIANGAAAYSSENLATAVGALVMGSNQPGAVYYRENQ